ncbi:MIP family channel protein [Nocardioides oleivorans]|uniref:MIP family channel protein n=1 Tax=Nocardioides oleivorans TaxID=273676 RepID=A0A4Q2RZQ7_9ACTN|nr:MIP family channel protein [Nocardioides oleivorans]RYB93193.1 MIP family channel protein [Nocardioides oleivorans]
MSDIVEDTPTTGQKFTAELLGTFVLVFFGCGAAIYSGGNIVSTGLTFGLTVVVMAYAVGRISGGHFNPAVTLGAVLGGRLPWNKVGIYFAAQLVGGLLAGAVLFGLGHGFDGFTAEGNMGQNFFGDQNPVAPYAWWAALLLEILLTAVFLWVILAVTDERNQINAVMGPLAIGLTLAMIHFVAIPLTGTSVNPARSIGVGVFAGTDAIVQLWLFVVAPFVGAAIAGLTYPILFGHGAEPVAGSGLNFGGGRKGDQFVPGNYEAQWNQGQQGGWGQPGAAWGAPPQQQWGQQPTPQQQPSQPQPDPYSTPQAPPAQWGQPAPQQQPPAQQPGQWGAPQQQPPAQPGQPSAPGHWGNPDGDDDGRTQVRRPD